MTNLVSAAPSRTPTPANRQHLVELLSETRARTLLLIAPVTEAELRRQWNRLMGPVLWDLGHIAHFEELWLLDNLRGEIRFGEMPGLFNPFENPRAVRGALDLPDLAGTLELLADVRRRVLASFDSLDWKADVPLLREGFVYQMVLQHEQQHNETMLQALKLKGGEPYRAPRAFLPPPGRTVEAERDGMVRFAGGEVWFGTDDRAAAYDNERPLHPVRLAPFWIDAAPVSNADYLRFMQEGGYGERRWWSEAGWRWLEAERVDAPMYWERRGREWVTRSFDRSEPVAPDHPVCHVCYHEAEAYARWAGKRLPTEVEWETACTWNPGTGSKHLFPWGDTGATVAEANLDQLGFGTAPLGSYRRNLSPLGCYGMIGDVWEWTTTDFSPYPGYQTFPYPEYSEVFFGADYKVLRGGSWATRPAVARATFRNWDYPIRRQIFSGFRCARDG